MANVNRRIVSLLPSTTEIIAALGFSEQLVGRSHECDVPASVHSLPPCTEPKFNPEGQSYEIDQRVKALLQEGISVYRVDAETLAGLQPDLIITQDHCEVCAASVSEVEDAVREFLGDEVEIISVSPTSLEEVFESIYQIAEVLESSESGRTLVHYMKNSLRTLSHETASHARKSVLCIEWLDPLMTAGNWVPELAEKANVQALSAEAGAHSPWVKWSDLRELQPDAICIMPCGYSIQQTLEEMSSLTELPGWNELGAVRNRQVFVADGHHYFNRPGPRLSDSARILAEILHPSLQPQYHGDGWINFYEVTEAVSG